MAMTVRRDPFARGEYKRFCLDGGRYRVKCDWCGQRKNRLFSYVWWSDDKPEPQEDSGEFFCDFSCFSSYRN